MTPANPNYIPTTVNYEGGTHNLFKFDLNTTKRPVNEKRSLMFTLTTAYDYTGTTSKQQTDIFYFC